MDVDPTGARRSGGLAGRGVDATVRRVAAAAAAFMAVGNRVERVAGAHLVRNPEASKIHDANHLQRVRAGTAAEMDALFSLWEERLGHLDHRHAVVDPATPDAFVTRLAFEGFQPEPGLQLLLEGPLRGPPPRPLAIRTAEDDRDWASLHHLLRENHLEQARRERRSAYPSVVTDQMLTTYRAKAPDGRFFLASDGDEDVGYFAAWPGTEGVGVVEDLFTRAPARRRGVARALIHHAVADARARGARAVVIGADPDDWPRLFYAALGFRPVCLTWSWLLRSRK